MICLEDSTERSESNPGRSLGIDKVDSGSCLEDSTTTWQNPLYSLTIRVRFTTEFFPRTRIYL